MVGEIKTLVLGASGYLGTVIYDHFKSRHPTYGTYMNSKSGTLVHLDVRDRNQVRGLLKDVKPDTLIVCTGITDVELCEENRELAFETNVIGIENIVSSYTGKLVYFSTDFVFDGEKGCYAEEDKMNPINYYGKTKAEAENIITGSSADYLIARVAALYGGAFENGKFVSWCKSKLAGGEEVRAITNYIRSPTYVLDIPPAIEKLVESSAAGVYHVAGPDRLSSYDMAKVIARKMGASAGLVKPISDVEYATKARRPRDATLNTQKIKDIGVTMTSFEDGADRLLSRQVNGL